MNKTTCIPTAEGSSQWNIFEGVTSSMKINHLNDFEIKEREREQNEIRLTIPRVHK